MRNPLYRCLGSLSRIAFMRLSQTGNPPEMPEPPKRRSITFELPPWEPIRPAPAPGVAKEPWQMTREGYVSFRNPQRKVLLPTDRPTLHIGDLEGMDADAKVYKKVGDVTLKRDNIGIYAIKDKQVVGYISELSPTEIDLSVVAEYQRRGIGTLLSAEFQVVKPGSLSGGLTEGGRKTVLRVHRQAVEQALAEGKPVPAEVLADYPDLARAIPKAPVSPEVITLDSTVKEAGTGCLPCSRHHLGRVAGLLEEALRFARTEGLGHPEVVRRIDMAEREIENMEAVDLTPENIAKLPPEQKELAEWALAKGRTLRHLLDGMNAQSEVSELEKTAVRSSEIATEYRARTWGLSPEVMRKLVEKAQMVKDGKITKEQALSELKVEVGNS